MTEFDPPLRLAKNTGVITLDDAAVFARSFNEARLPKTRVAVLRLIEGACTEPERRVAASGFGAWVRAEASLMQALRLGRFLDIWPNTSSIRS